MDLEYSASYSHSSTASSVLTRGALDSWFLPLDGVKFATRFGIRRWNAARGKTGPAAFNVDEDTGIALTRTTSRAASVHASLYSNRVNFIQRAQRKVGLKKVSVDAKELRRISSHQVRSTGATLQR